MSVPCGFNKQGLPVWLQLIGNVLEKGKLFQVGYAYKQATDWHNQKLTLR